MGKLGDSFTEDDFTQFNVSWVDVLKKVAMAHKIFHLCFRDNHHCRQACHYVKPLKDGKRFLLYVANVFHSYA